MKTIHPSSRGAKNTFSCAPNSNSNHNNGIETIELDFGLTKPTNTSLEPPCPWEVTLAPQWVGSGLSSCPASTSTCRESFPFAPSVTSHLHCSHRCLLARLGPFCQIDSRSVHCTAETDPAHLLNGPNRPFQAQVLPNCPFCLEFPIFSPPRKIILSPVDLF